MATYVNLDKKVAKLGWCKWPVPHRPCTCPRRVVASVERLSFDRTAPNGAEIDALCRYLGLQEVK